MSDSTKTRKRGPRVDDGPRVDECLSHLRNPSDPNRYMLRRKVCVGQFGWRPGKGGKPTYDYRTHFFASREELMRAARKTGCDCCARAPKVMKWGVWYRAGYADYVMIQKAR